MRMLGLIKWFDNEKEFGILGLPDDTEVFLHKNNILNPEKEIKPKQAFIFDIADGKKGIKAINAIRPSSTKDFEFILSFLGKNQTVGIEELVKRSQHVSKNYFRTNSSKEIVRYNIIGYGLSPILNSINSLGIFELFKNYFDSKIDVNNYQILTAYIERTKITVLSRKIELTGFLLENFKNNNQLNNFSSSITNEQKHLLEELLKYYLEKISSEFKFQLWKDDLNKIKNKVNSELNLNELIAENVFIESNTVLPKEDIERLIREKRDKKIIFKFIIKLIKSISINEIRLLSALYPAAAELEFDNEYKSEIKNKCIELLSKINYNAFNHLALQDFKAIYDCLHRILYQEELDLFYNNFNKTINDETIILLLESLQYCKLPESFFTKNIKALSSTVFAHAPEVFRLNYFKRPFNEVMSFKTKNYIKNLVEFIDEINSSFKSVEQKKEIFNFISTKLSEEDYIYLWENDYTDRLNITIIINQLEKIDKYDRGFVLKKIFEQIKSLSEYEQKSALQSILAIINKNEIIELWYGGSYEKINIDLIVDGFCEITAEKQPNILRKLFSQIAIADAINKKALTQKLLKIKTEMIANLNVRICIAVLKGLEESNTLIGENEISEIIFSTINENYKNLIQINDLFEECEGMTWEGGGLSDKNTWYIKIEEREFAIKNNEVHINEHTYPIDKENKQVIIENKTYRFQWVKKNQGNTVKLYPKPKGVTFCDAIKGATDETLGKHFFWCCNKACYAPRQNDHLIFEWRKYSLRDFIRIAELPFEQDKYYRFIGVLNRANRLLEKLNCIACGYILRDARTSNFSFYRVNSFHCTNIGCTEHHKIVYLNHCLNWKCNNIVDSRISKRCPNGMVICNECGECCSTKIFQATKNRFVENGVFNINNEKHAKLNYLIEHNLGHLEKGERYDYKTGEKCN